MTEATYNHFAAHLGEATGEVEARLRRWASDCEEYSWVRDESNRATLFFARAESRTARESTEVYSESGSVASVSGRRREPSAETAMLERIQAFSPRHDPNRRKQRANWLMNRPLEGRGYATPPAERDSLGCAPPLLRWSRVQPS